MSGCCPHCGADRDDGTRYSCGTMVLPAIPTRACLVRELAQRTQQRDNAAGDVSRLLAMLVTTQSLLDDAAARLKAEADRNARLTADNHELLSLIRQSEIDNVSLRDRHVTQAAADEIARLTAEVAQLRSERESRCADVARYAAEADCLTAEVERLRAALERISNTGTTAECLRDAIRVAYEALLPSAAEVCGILRPEEVKG